MWRYTPGFTVRTWNKLASVHEKFLTAKYFSICGFMTYFHVIDAYDVLVV